MATFRSVKKMKTINLTDEELEILQDDISSLIADEEDNNLQKYEE